MTRKILIALMKISLVLLAAAPSYLAQDRQLGDRTPVGGRPQGDRQILTPEAAAKMRSDLITAYAESDALVKFLAGYDFLRQSQAMEDYESVCEQLAKERARVEQLSLDEVMLEAGYWPNSESLNRIIEVSRAVRTDAKFQEAIAKAERYYQANQSRSSSAARGSNSRAVIASPAFIAPICNFDDPSNYPSGTDLAISNGIGIALHVLYDVLPDEEGFLFGIPFLPKILLVIAAGVADEVTNALNAVATDARYCESLRLYIEDKLANEASYNALLMTDDFYLTFTFKTVKASFTKAISDGIPLNCGQTRLTEATAFFNSSDTFTGTGPQRVTAYQKLRAAFQNIGAKSCVQ